MKNDIDKSVSDLDEEMNVAVLRDAGWYPDSTEISSGGATGSGSTAFSVRTPLMDLLAKEPLEEGDAEFTAQQKRWMTEGAFLIIREAIGSGKRVDVVDVGLTLCTWAWDIQLPPFNSMSMEDVGDLAGQGRAAVCERHKQKVEKKKVAAGMRATKTQRQKPASMVAIYAESQRGNTNRSGKKRRDLLLSVA